MAQANPNGIYKGYVHNSSERNAATLTIISSDPQTGNITNATMDYYGLKFKVDGTFAYQNLGSDSPVSFSLRAQVSGGENNLHNITLTSADRNYTTLNGKTYVARGGPNVSLSYDITFKKS